MLELSEDALCLTANDMRSGRSVFRNKRPLTFFFAVEVIILMDVMAEAGVMA